MKKTLLSLFTIFGLAMTSQTLTQANHAPMDGFKYELFQCDTNSITSGASGAGATWNFTSLATTTAAIANYTTAVASNTTYAAADISISASAMDIAYYKSSAADLKYYGGDVSFGFVSGNVIYSNPAIYATYPMGLNASVTSTPSGSISVFGNNGVIGGTVTALADGTGTLNIDAPGAAAGTTLKSFTNVTRVKTTENLSGNINVGLPITYTISRVNYDYYSPTASRAALLTISNSTIILNALTGPTVNVTKAITVQNNYNVVSINENKINNIQLSVFPNPAINSINFTTTSAEATNVVAYDISGKAVCSEAIESGKAKINTSNFTSGIYMYRVVGKYNQVLTTGKFTVSK
ncbi:MAG: T9SS type A sorting domain-containing protein [Bacteroidia bacterium]|nr:T9SS type A sorting domain-containing protein [Bacteroidia bacterium]